MAVPEQQQQQQQPRRRNTVVAVNEPRHIPGLGIDAYGGGVIDPTENVKALMEASIRSLTDRQNLLAALADEKIRSQEALASNREAHAKELRESEAKRLDAIRATDVAAVGTTAAQSLAAIQELAR